MEKLEQEIELKLQEWLKWEMVKYPMVIVPYSELTANITGWVTKSIGYVKVRPCPFANEVLIYPDK